MAKAMKMSCKDVMTELESMGDEKARRTHLAQGGTGTVFGVKISDLKIVLKKVKKDHQLALELYQTDNLDAQYLAGMAADPKVVTVDELQAWVGSSTSYWIAEYSVAGLAADSPHGWHLGLKWIDSEQDKVCSAGWATLAHHCSVRADEELDLKEIEKLLSRVVETIDSAPNRTRYTMNGFVIAVGSTVLPLLSEAQAAAVEIGKVAVDMGGTACKVPLASERIEKMRTGTRYGKKRKTAQC